jgi:hypothetical protein
MKKLFFFVLAALAAAPAALAQERRTFSQPELEQLLAPVALYPDALLSQVLMASTYPLDIVEAARWSRAHPGLQGDEAVAQAANEDWDPSVKSLLAFPGLLTRMDEKLDWTRRLGDAFLEQEPHVMETVQRLRRKAEAAGQLASGERMRVIEDGGVIVIEQLNPYVVYVPYYDPWVAYGAWGWPAYPPVAWSPWTGYAVGVTAGFFFGGIDWHHRHVRVVHVQNHYVRPHLARHAQRPLQVGKWQHVAPQRRQVERPAHFVPHARSMPPALSASPQPQRRMEAPRRTERPRQSEPQRRLEAPRPVERTRPIEPRQRAEVPRAQPQPRFAAPSQAREPRPALGASPGGRDGGWQRHPERNGRRG